MNLLPYIIVLLAAILWGTTGALHMYLKEDISSFEMSHNVYEVGGILF